MRHAVDDFRAILTGARRRLALACRLPRPTDSACRHLAIGACRNTAPADGACPVRMLTDGVRPPPAPETTAGIGPVLRRLLGAPAGTLRRRGLFTGGRAVRRLAASSRRLALAALLLATPAGADAVATPTPARLGEDALSLATAGRTIELARDTGTISANARSRRSDLRVALAMLPNGARGRFAPPLDLHLVLLNAVDGHGLAWAVEPVASVFRVERVLRSPPGLYEIVAVVHDPAGAGNGCHFRRAVLSIDARALSVIVRHAAGPDAATARRQTEPVHLSVEPLDCARRPPT